MEHQKFQNMKDDKYQKLQKIQELEERIADKIQDFQADPNYGKPYDALHVDTWICQFPEQDREAILMGTDRLLEQNYMSRKKIENFFDSIWNTKDIFGEKPFKTLNYAQFLDIQGKGSSQKRLVKLIEDYYYSSKGIVINRMNHKKVNRYFYLDDCMYTGLTLLKDIRNWIQSGEPHEGAELDVIFLGMYDGNYMFVEKRLEEICAEKKIKPNIYRLKKFRNGVHGNPPYDVFWPRNAVEDPYVEKYLAYLNSMQEKHHRNSMLYRSSIEGESEPEMFLSSENRDILERELLKKGAYIWSLTSTPNERLKPLGYTPLISLGYGAFFATCYNISNNCPLAFWWGTTAKERKGPLGKWYPLLAREANSVSAEKQQGKG